MYIKSLYLKNVAPIYNGMQLEEIDVDFDTGNNINLFCGTNGSGKTGFQTAMNPFNTEDYRVGMKGEKRIVYRKKNSIITITHQATPNNNQGHSIKYYIEKHKNGKITELNENGNLSSFLDVVERELDITPSRYKLLHLGTDLLTIAKMTPSQRKEFISNFTNDADYYLAKQKKVKDDNLALEKLLKQCVGAMSKLGNEEDIKERMTNIEQDKETLKNRLHNITLELGNCEKVIEEFNKLDDSYVEKYKNIKEIKSKLGNELSELSNDELNKIIDMNNRQIDTLTRDKTFILQSLEDKKKMLDMLEEQIDEMVLTLSTLKYTQLDNNYMDLIDEAAHQLRVLSVDYTKFKNIIGEGNNAIINTLMSTINKYEFDASEIKTKIIYEPDIDDYADSSTIINLVIEYKARREELVNGIIETSARIKVLQAKQADSVKVPPDYMSCHGKKCPFLENYTDPTVIKNQLEDLNNKWKSANSEVDGIDNKLVQLELVLKLHELHDNIINFIKTLPIEITKYIKLNEKYIDNFYDRDRLNELMEGLNVIKIYENYKVTYETLTKDKSDNDKVNGMKGKINVIRSRVNEIKEKCDTDNNKIDQINTVLDSAKDTIDVFNEYIKLREEYGSFDIIEQKAKEYGDAAIKWQEAEMSSGDIRDNIKQINYSLSSNDKILEELSFKLKSIKQNKREKELIERYLLDNKYLLDSLSTNKGIPMVLVNTFLQSTREVANKIIMDAFDGELQIGEMYVGPKDFRIPLIGNGDGVQDISKASAGERAIANIALALAINKQKKTKYNIINLDELDGPLDDVKRRKFMNLIQKYMEEEGIDQLNNITHNNLFNDIKANILLFRGAKVDNLVDKEVIFKY
jgi:hypothetical protein